MNNVVIIMRPLISQAYFTMGDNLQAVFTLPYKFSLSAILLHPFIRSSFKNEKDKGIFLP